MWAIALGMAAPWVILVPIWLVIERYRDRRASRQAQACLQAWEAAHSREAPDEVEHGQQGRDRDMTPESPEARLAHLEERLARLEAIVNQLVQRLAYLEGYLGQRWPYADGGDAP
jgi:flagellar biosynthesis/type III secretory pathway M-ring protein FliF/YscJ